jgi:hypothetical protein
MDTLATTKRPIIKAGGVFKNPVFTPKTLEKYEHRIESLFWEDGAAGQKTLPIYFNDGATGTTRPLLIEFRAFSQFGLGFFKGKTDKKATKKTGKKKRFDSEDDQPTKKDKKSKEQEPEKPKVKAANIAFDLNTSEDVQILDSIAANVVGRIMKDKLPALENLVSPGEKLHTVYRKAARASSGRSRRSLRCSAYPGGVELYNEEKDHVPMSKFPMDLRDKDYRVIIEWTSINATNKEGVISYGPVFIVRTLGFDDSVQRPALGWRKEGEEDLEEGEIKAGDLVTKKENNEIVKDITEEIDRVKKEIENAKKKRKREEKEEEQAKVV